MGSVNYAKAECTAQMIIWIKEHEALMRSTTSIRAKETFERETGLSVPRSSFDKYRITIYPDLKRKPSVKAWKVPDINAFVMDLDKRLKAIEEQLL